MGTATASLTNGTVPSTRRIHSDQTSLIESDRPHVPAKIVVISDAGTSTQSPLRIPPRRASIEELFPEADGLPPELPNARRLLAACIQNVKEALSLAREEDIVSADDTMAHVIVSLPELFCCRALGDGFGMLVNAIQGAFENRRGTPLERAQLEGLLRAFEKLRGEPFLKTSTAVDEIIALEETGLNPEPPAYAYLVDWLDGDTASIR